METSSTPAAPASNNRRWLKRLFWVVLLLLAAVIALGLLRMSNGAGPMPEALAAMQSGGGVEFSEAGSLTAGSWLVFRPQTADPLGGVIFYPGGGVDYRSYAPAARALAEAGYLAVIPSMPFNLAVLAPERAGQIIAAFPEVTRWAIGGHSLGGVMASRYASRHADQIAGLYLWASYPADTENLSGQPLQVVSVYGTLDGLATPEQVLAARPLLPPDTAWVPIEGGNHAQFGWYGPQDGDNPAAITREDQQNQAITAVLQMLLRCCAPPN